MKKYCILLLVLFITAFSYSQGGLPAVVMKDDAIPAANMWVVDPDSLRGNYPFTTNTLTITETGGNHVGVFLDSFSFRSDGDFIKIFDGNSTSDPLLSIYTRSNVTAWAVKSSGNTLTIQWHGSSDLAVSKPVGWRIGVRIVSDITTDTASFLPIFQGNLNKGFSDAADYDNDGDLDVVIGGTVYQNDSNNDSSYLFERILSPIGSWRSAQMVTADFDNDGFKDVFMTGLANLTSPGYRATTALFKNNGDKTFSRVTGLALPDAAYGGCSIVDFNNDGKPDIAYTGTSTTLSNAFFKLYINNGNFTFTDMNIATVPGVLNASLDWFDYDNDGDKDLLMNGYNNSGNNIAAVFKNNANTSFTKVDVPFMHNTSAGQIKWVDIDGNGVIDIINTGVNTPGNVDAITPELLMNDGSGNFTRIITNLPARGLNSLDLYDFDGDNDKDIVYGGLFANSPESDACVYKNNGNGNFTKIYDPQTQNLTTVKWVDINKDGRMDVFLGGRDNYHPSIVAKNMGGDVFKNSSYPFTGYTPSTYRSNVAVDDFNNDDLPDFLFAGEIDNQDCVEGATSTLNCSYGWRKTPVASLKKVIDLFTIPGANPSTGSIWKWGDVDNDGKPDILLTKQDQPLRVFKNNGNGNFTLMYSGFPSSDKLNPACGVIDIDNDGINELYIVPNKLYRWNGTGFQTLYVDFPIACEGQGFSCDLSACDFADYNNDGYMDVAFMQGHFLYFLRNNKQGRLVNDYNTDFASMGPENYEELNWFDFNNDGAPDLLTSRWLLENMGTMGMRSRGLSIPPHGNIAFSDFNKDGTVDILSINKILMYLPAHIYYNQQGTSFFQEQTPENFIQTPNGTYNEGISVFDLDNDGDDDIIYSTAGDCTFSGVYLNRYNEGHKNIHVQWPNGGEVIVSGTNTVLRWSGLDLGPSVKIEFSINSGSTYTVITASAASSRYGGEYNWTVPNISASGNCLIRITDNTDNSIVDVSNKVFKISSVTPVIDITRSDIIKVYPNPTNGIMLLEPKKIPAGTTATISFTDINGKQVFIKKQQLNGGIVNIADISHFSPGIYILNVTYKNERLVQKIVKF